MLLSETVSVKDWEATGWKIQPYHFALVEVPPPADDITLRTPKLDKPTLSGFSLDSEKGARREQEESGDDAFIAASPDSAYRLLRPIPVRLEHGEDGEWIACFSEANISMPGSSPKDARQALADDIVEAFALFLAEEETLGPGPQKQLTVLRQYIQPRT